MGGLHEPTLPAANTPRLEAAKWKKINNIKIAKYTHDGKGTNWTGHKQDLMMQFMQVNHDEQFEKGAKIALLGY